MADYGWRNDSRRQWDAERDRFRDDHNRFGRPDWRNDEHFLGDRFGENWNRWERDGAPGRQQDFGRDGEYASNYATPRHSGDMRRRPGGMRDDDWRAGRRSAFGDRGNDYGSYPPDYQDYGDWQNQDSASNYGGPRFGDNYMHNQDMYGRGYGNYGRQREGYAPAGPDYGDSRETNRNFWNRASDEVASWVGDDDAGRRRDMDRMRDHSGHGPKGYIRSDDRIREDINERLTADWRLDATNIDASVSEGEVTLAGTVDSRDGKHRAEHLVENLNGVRHVQNNLRVDERLRMTGTSPALSTPVGSSGTATSQDNAQNRPGSYSSQSSASSPTGPDTPPNANSTH